MNRLEVSARRAPRRWLPTRDANPKSRGRYRVIVLMPCREHPSQWHPALTVLEWTDRGWLRSSKMPPGTEVIGWIPRPRFTDSDVGVMIDEAGNLETFLPMPPINAEVIRELTEE